MVLVSQPTTKPRSGSLKCSEENWSLHGTSKGCNPRKGITNRHSYEGQSKLSSEL
jgi:hypothetical protein